MTPCLPFSAFPRRILEFQPKMVGFGVQNSVFFLLQVPCQDCLSVFADWLKAQFLWPVTKKHLHLSSILVVVSNLWT